MGYHAHLPGFSGGFVGVDVFFVISGYLILGQIEAGLASGRFRLWTFYARRFLRILPPLLLVLVASALVARVALVTPDDLREFRHEIVSSALLYANHHFLRSEGDYFGRAIQVKPLLHTWSLMVEEQFYLVAPLAAMAVHGAWRRLRGRSRAAAGLVVAGLFAASLLASVRFTDPEYNAAFFLMPLRAWEFAAGGLVSLLLPFVARSPAPLRPWLAPLGLAAIVVSTTCFDATTPYPALFVALPVAGSVLLIAANLTSPRTRMARWMSAGALAGIGLLSYGWYLWHWPLLVFGRLALPDAAPLQRDLCLVTVALAVAFVTYRLVERPVRRSRGALLRRPRLVVGFAAVILAAFAITGQSQFQRLQAAAATERTALLAEQSAPAQEGLAQPGNGVATAAPRPARASAILMGDSHAGVLAQTLTQAASGEAVELVQSTRLGCLALLDVDVFAKGMRLDRCRGFWDETLAALHETKPAVRSAIIAQNWMMYLGTPDVSGHGRTSQIGPSDGPVAEDALAFLRERLLVSLSALEAAGVERILLVGPVPDFGHDPVNCVMRAHRFSGDLARCRQTVSAGEPYVSALRKTLEAVVTGHPGRRWVDPASTFCADGLCSAVDGDGRLLFADRSHLSGAGAARFERHARSDLDWSLGVR